MFLDLTPLRYNKEFRYLYIGQFVSFFGTMLSLVALPYQVYQITSSTFAVGMLALVELVPLLITAFIGGALSDIMDRKKLLIRAELGLAFCCALLLANALLPTPQVWPIYVLAGIMAALNGLHRPSLDALLPRLVQKHEIQATSVLGMFKSVFGMIGGPAVAGLCIAHFGLSWTFFLDLITFIISILSLSFLSPKPPLQQKMPFTLNNIYEAIRYACSRQELLGTYIIDFVAMVCAMPNALFPALATILGGTKVLGWLYSAPAIGALIVTLLSGWTKKIRRHGLVIGVAACSWGSAIICFGFSESLGLTLLFLCAAGAANGVSVIFRRTIWNETIPDRIRGRMASLEMISYTSGPLLGNAHAGVMPTVIGLQNSIVVGGCLCVLGVVSTLILLPKFWGYEKCDHLEKI